MTKAYIAQDPALPWDGVLEVLSGWSGRGQLYAALASVAESGSDAWTGRDVQRRARRVLFAELLSTLTRLPTTAAAWLDALPAQSHHRREVVVAPAGRVDWSRTRSRGWPPKEFVTRTRGRRADELLTTVLCWTLNRLLEVADDATRVLPGIDVSVHDQLTAALAVLEVPVLAARGPSATPPTGRDLTAVRSSGRPWTTLADLAAQLLAEDTRLDELARRLVLPDDDLRWRLFHLGCLGALITALRKHGCTTTWLRPLGATTNGPTYTVTDPRSRQWDLWFEAAGMWRWYRAPSPYRAVRTALPGAPQPLGADLALIGPDRQGLLIECKYSADARYVGRNGYEQALAYLTEARSGLLVSADAAVLGPSGVVSQSASVTTHSGTLTMTDPPGLDALVTHLLST